MALPTGNFSKEEILAEIKRRKATEGLNTPKQAPSKPVERRTGLPRVNTPSPNTRPVERHLSKAAVEDEVYSIDEKTGKRYKKLGKQKDGVHKADTVSGLLDKGVIDEDIDADDLVGSASIFLAHLRVPPSKEELEQYRRERAEKLRKIKEEESRKNNPTN